MENHELRVLTLSLNLDIYRVTALNCEAAGGARVELRLLKEQWAAVPSELYSPRNRLTRLFFHPHCRLVPETPMGPMMLMDRNAFFGMKGVVHEGAFGTDWAVRGVWAVFWKFPHDALSSPLTGVPLPVGEYEMHADEWATIGKELGGGLATKLRVDAAAAGVPAVHCLRVGEVRIAAISSMGIFGDFWKATADEKRRANALCTGLRGLGVDAFPCHGQHHLIVFRHWRPPGGARVDMSPPRFSALLQRDARVLELLATVFLPPPPRAADWKAWKGAKWMAHHCAVFPGTGPGAGSGLGSGPGRSRGLRSAPPGVLGVPPRTDLQRWRPQRPPARQRADGPDRPPDPAGGTGRSRAPHPGVSGEPSTWRIAPRGTDSPQPEVARQRDVRGKATRGITPRVPRAPG